MNDLISKLSEIRSEYNCFNQDEEPYYRALSKAISVLSRHTDNDTISRQAAIDAMNAKLEDIKLRWRGKVKKGEIAMYLDMRGTIETLPSAQPEIIRCNSCKYWTQSTGGMKGYGLGRCDFHDADLVACNGFCYWAERRTDDKTNKSSSC